MVSAWDWAATASGNGGSNQPAGFANGQLPSSVSAFFRNLQAFLTEFDHALTTTGSANAYVGTLNNVPTSLSTGMAICVNPNFTNTGASTFNLNSLGAKNIKLNTAAGLIALTGGEMQNGGEYWLVYDGTQWQLLNPTFSPADLATKSTPTTSDSILIMDAAASNAAKTGTLPAVIGALFSPITNSLGGNVSLNNVSNYFDGPSIAQGSTGTWWVSGNVTVIDTAGSAFIDAKLWDGTTVIASGRVLVPTGGSGTATISLSGFLATPAGNLRISARDETSVSGIILSNGSGNSKDSTISAIRIA